MKKIVTFAALLAASLFLVACGRNSNTQTPTKVSSTSTSTAQASASSSSQASSTASSSIATTELDGTYVLQEWDEVKTLTISNGAGTLESRDTGDGEIDIDQVTVNAADKTVTIGDDLKTYSLNGNTLTLTEADGDVDVYTKQ